ncbi:MAG: type I glutamate--ammonia ligase [candidate division Zixibacteria bacterium]|nr:type I glutamate--ammonia ligase [candidate division Zixibacteria bacterium]
MKIEGITDLASLAAFARENDIANLDLKFVDLAGRWRHVTVPAARLGSKLFEYGVGFDGSQSPGYKTIEAGDLVLKADATTAMFEPFWEKPTISLICNIHEADTGERFARDPRALAQRAEAYLAGLGVAEGYWLSPEYEFHLLRNVYYASEAGRCLYFANAPEEEEGSHISAAVATPGYNVPREGGYHSIPPLDEYYDLRAEMAAAIEASGLPVRYHHHEVGATGQCEIEVGFLTLVAAADMNLWVKFLIRNLARWRDMYATFMPKPIYGEAGNGMHVHQFLGSAERSAFYDAGGYGGLGDLGRHFMGGILKHGRSLAAFTNAATNSYKRLVPGFEAPVRLFYSIGNRSGTIRIPKYAARAEEARFEYRPPDATCNPYLAFSAMLMAGLDGVLREINPGEPIEEDLSKMPKAKQKRIRSLPKSLVAALDDLRGDHDYLLAGGVFTEDIIDAYIETKMEYDVRALDQRPHPHEYILYFDM